MIVQMIMCQICKDHRIKINRIDSSLFDTDRRSFQSTCFNTVFHHFSKDAMQIIDIRCCQKRRQFDVAVFNRNCSDIAGWHKRIEQITDDAGNGGFTIGACNTIHLQTMRRMTIECICHIVIGTQYILYSDVCHIISHRFQIRTVNDDFCAILDCLIDELMTIKHHSLDTEEDGIRSFLTGIRHQIGNFNIRCLIKQFTQLHYTHAPLRTFYHLHMM